LNDAVLFRSDRFSLDPAEADGRRYDLPLGDDLAGLVAERLRRADSALQVLEPVREGWGTVLEVRAPEPFLIYIHWAPDGRAEDRWGIQFARPVGCVGYLLGRRSRPQDCRRIQALVADLLARESETFAQVEWLSQAEYDQRT
jgi:hypothetical protein